MPDRRKLFIVLAVVVAVLLVLAYKDDPSAGTSQSGSAGTTIEESDSGLPRFVEVGAESCVPCRMMQPILDEMRTEYDGRLEVVMADVHRNPELGRRYDVRSIPTQVIYDAEGNEVFRHIGFWPKDEIDAKLKELGIID
ncbi:MAG: thioredoxin family protein [Armatimonadota bacterium]